MDRDYGMSEKTKRVRYRRRPIISGVIWLGLGLYLLALHEGLVPGIEDSWPVIIVIVGIAIIFGAFFRKPHVSVTIHHQHPDNSGGSSGRPTA